MRNAAKRAGLLLLWAALLAAPAAAQTIVSRIDLSPPFAARPGWRFLAMQDPEIVDELETGFPEREPGVIRLCISRDGGRSCRPDLSHLLGADSEQDRFSVPHFLHHARVVRPRPGQALLLIEVASLPGVNGNQRTATAALIYDRRRDAFVSAYEKETGRNNNEEVRYIPDGPLRGAIVSAEPAGNAPFGYWIIVNRLAPSGRYRQILRYRSATIYGDGNPLAVIDSEMPNIQRQLRLWRPGQPLPLPARGCRRPHLVNRALWC